MNNSDQRARQEALLLKLVTMARYAQPRAWDSFVALHLGGTTVTIYHPRAMPLSIPLDQAGDLEVLADEGAIELTRTMRGSRVFTITSRGYQRTGGIRHTSLPAAP